MDDIIVSLEHANAVIKIYDTISKCFSARDSRLARDITDIVVNYRYLGDTETDTRKALTADDKLYDFAKNYITTFIQSSDLDEKHLPYQYWISMSIKNLKSFMITYVKKYFGNKCPLSIGSSLDLNYSCETFKIDKKVSKFIDGHVEIFQECFHFTGGIYHMLFEEMSSEQLSDMEIQKNVPDFLCEFICICYEFPEIDVSLKESDTKSEADSDHKGASNNNNSNADSDSDGSDHKGASNNNNSDADSDSDANGVATKNRP